VSNFNALVVSVDSVRAEDEMAGLVSSACAFAGGDGIKKQIRFLKQRIQATD